jgi:hypothetical protein
VKEANKQGRAKMIKEAAAASLPQSVLGCRSKVGPTGGGEAVGPTLGPTLGPTQRNAEWAALRSYRLPRNSKRKRECIANHMWRSTRNIEPFLRARLGARQFHVCSAPTGLLCYNLVRRCHVLPAATFPASSLWALSTNLEHPSRIAHFDILWH